MHFPSTQKMLEMHRIIIVWLVTRPEISNKDTFIFGTMKRKFLTYCCGAFISAYTHRSLYHPVTGFVAIRRRHRNFSISYPTARLQGNTSNRNFIPFATLQQRWLQRSTLSALSGVAGDKKNTKVSSVEGSTSTPNPSSTMDHTFRRLAKAWTPRLIAIENADHDDHKKIHCFQRETCEAAVQRTIPLFLQVVGNITFYDDAAAASVPFVCRYRTDVIHPLTTQQVHLLRSMVGQHDSLRNLRNKLLPHFPPQDADSEVNVTTVRGKILTSVSKSELEDLYMPFKPPPKGSVFSRLQSQYPELVDSIEAVWKDRSSIEPISAVVKNWSKLAPREVIVKVLGTKIAAEPQVMCWMMESLRSHCRIKSTVIVTKKTDAKSKTTTPKQSRQITSKYSEAYGDFSALAMYLKYHQVLAIRRGVKEKALKMTFDIDSEKMERYLLWMIRKGSGENKFHSKDETSPVSNAVVPISLSSLLSYSNHSLMKEAIHDAWCRLLRRRGTDRLWAEKCKEAQERACQVFEDNLQRALLVPPYRIPARPLLAMDPGFRAGIKCALLDSEGSVIRLSNVRFLGSEKTKMSAVTELEGMLRELHSLVTSLEKVTIALGNGRGSGESRELIQTASTNCDIPIDIQIVSEAGASVWSVTENAKAEFPYQPPAAVAAISIGRRLQNPLFELVKVPPKSLGLGMYQHDLSEKELDEKLHLTSVDAVAVVGVDVNSCSLEILQKVPGLSSSLSRKIINARPLEQRKDMLKVSGLGPKSYENCAGFVRVANGPEPLDNTLVHPESYDLARWLLKEFSWKLDHSGKASTIQHNRDEWRTDWEDSVAKAAKKHNVNCDRVLAVLENLVDSASNEDPRLKLLQSDTTNPSSKSASSSLGIMVASCKALPDELSDTTRMWKCIAEQDGPIRGIVGTILNVADFGAFVDIGNENIGLLHISKLGPSQKLQNLLIGQDVGVDILSVTPENDRISLGLHGYNLQASVPRSSGPRSRPGKSRVRGSSSTSFGRTSGKKRSISTLLREKQAIISHFDDDTNKKRSISTLLREKQAIISHFDDDTFK